jgi:hypothetical protein
MPLIEDEALTYGYIHESRHMVSAFRRGLPRTRRRMTGFPSPRS